MTDYTKYMVDGITPGFEEPEWPFPVSARNSQPEALRLADALQAEFPGEEVADVAAAELRRLHALCAEWNAKAATWLASPEAAKRLDGYRELTARIAALVS